MGNKFSFLESKIDSERFGIKVAKINQDIFLKSEVFDELKKNNFQLIISRIKGENIEIINYLEANRFHLKDVQLTYKFDLKKDEIKYEYLNDQVVVREANEWDIESLKSIAAECFWNYGHYFSDKKLNKQDCIEVYKDWTVRAVLDKNFAEKFFLAELEGVIVGYLFFVMKENEKGRFSSSGLGAVASTGRGQNIFSTLAIKSLEWAKSEDQIWQEHNVLNINYPVNRVFSKLGMSVYRSELTFHSWL